MSRELQDEEGRKRIGIRIAWRAATLWIAPGIVFGGNRSASPRTVRGGSWNDRARSCRSATRGSGSASLRFSPIGFRLAATK